MVSSAALSSTACGSSPLSRSCQLSSEGDALDDRRDAWLPTAFPHLAAALPTLVSEQAMLSTLITAHSDGAASFCVQSASAEVPEGVALPGGDGDCALAEEAAQDKAMAASSASEGVVGGVWKKSKGEPEIAK